MDTENLKQNIDAEELLDNLGAEKVSKIGNRLRCLCLHPDHDDSNPSFYFHLEKDNFTCYSCGWYGDAIELVQVVKELTFKNALKYLRNMSGFKSTGVTTEDLIYNLERRKKLLSSKKKDMKYVRLPSSFDSNLIGYKRVRSFIKKRKWNIDLLNRYSVGFCPSGYFTERIIFPIRDSDNKIITFAGRDISGLSDQKYLYPKDSEISGCIWGLHDKMAKKAPIFVEGITDALRLREHGFNGFAVLGNNLGDKKLDLIIEEFKDYPRIILVPDNDNGGNILLKWFLKLVHSFHVDVCLIKDKNDVDDMNRLEIIWMLKHKQPLTDWQVNFFMKGE